MEATLSRRERQSLRPPFSRTLRCLALILARRADQSTVRAWIGRELSAFPTWNIPCSKHACSDPDSGLILGESPANHAQIQSLSGTSGKPCQRGLSESPFHYQVGSKELNITTVQDPTHSKLRFRKATQARNVQSTDSWILAFSTSTKPIMAGRGATENFVARWCSGLA